MLLMHSSSISPRLKYISEFIGHEMFGSPIRLTTDRREYIDWRGPRINYSSEDISEGEFRIHPVALLFETGIREQNTHCIEINFHKVFFETAGDLHFDIFAASFYLLSRYEEYLPFEKDHYGRFPHHASLAHREKFLHLPLVNIWVTELEAALKNKFPDIVFKGKSFSNIITYDIDIAYSYLYKGLPRTIGGTLRSISRGEWRLVWERWQVLLGFKKDPFDCFEWLDALQLYCRLKPWYFFLVASQRSQHDKNTSTSARPFRKLVEYYASNYNAGIHPSWRSGEEPLLLSEEKEWLETVAGKTITASRQHYLRMTLPVTYRQLIARGIDKDFSMGYGACNGFRASISSPFPWYDVEKEETTRLTIYPFCFMDAAALFALQLTPDQAYQELANYHNIVRKVNGMLVTVWHNHIIGDDARTKGWHQMFELFMKEIVYWDAYYDRAG